MISASVSKITGYDTAQALQSNLLSTQRCHHLAADRLGGAFRLGVAAQVDGDVVQPDMTS